MNRRSGLGRGLGSLIPSEAMSDSSGDLLDIPVSAISANSFQPRSRFDEESLVSLTDSIRELGVLQPILVRELEGGRFELIAGERRWRAARRAGLPTIPAVVRDVDDQASLEQAIVENLHREDLNALEEASAFQQLIDEFSLTQDQVARRVGKSRSAVANTLRLFQLPGSVQKMVATGELSAGHARALLGTPDRARQESLARVVVREGMSVRQVEDLVRVEAGADLADNSPRTPTPHADRRSTTGNAEAAPPASVGYAETADENFFDAVDIDELESSGSTIGETKPAALLELEELLGNHLATRVQVGLGRSKGRMVIDFADLEDLKRIYQIMMRDPAALA